MLQRWLDLLCESLPGTQLAAIYPPAGPHAEAAAPLAVWPAGACPDPHLARQAALLEAGAGAVVCPAGSGSSAHLTIARNLQRAGSCAPRAALVVQLRAGADQQPVVMRLLDWALRWLQLIDTPADRAAPVRAVDVPAEAGDVPRLDPVNVLLRAPELDAGLTEMASLLCRQHGLERVFVLRDLGRHLQVCAISDSVRVDARAQLLADVASVCARHAMPDRLAHARGPLHALANSHALGPLELVQLPGPDNRAAAAGLLLLEGQSDRVPDAARAAITSCAEALGAALHLRQQLQRSTRQRLHDYCRRQVVALTGPAYLPLKATLAALAILLPVLTLVPADYEVAAPAQLEGRVQRAIVAPFAGFVGRQLARAGDIVEAGQLVAELDARDLLIEQGQLQGELDSADRQYRQALAAREQSEARLYAAQVEQIEARLALLRAQLARTRLVAPMAGIIISGDLSRALDAPVERGDVLFEVAPLHDYRVAVNVPENAIAAIAVGQRGALVLKSTSGAHHAFELTRVGEASEQDDGSVSFRAEGRLLEVPDGELRPGMTGTARISAGQRSLLWLAGHDVLDWLRLLAWRWLP